MSFSAAPYRDQPAPGDVHTLPKTMRDLLWRIRGLDRLFGCFASDADLGAFIGRAPGTVRNLRRQLIALGYLRTEWGSHPFRPDRITRFLVPCSPAERFRAADERPDASVAARNAARPDLASVANEHASLLHEIAAARLRLRVLENGLEEETAAAGGTPCPPCARAHEGRASSHAIADVKAIPLPAAASTTQKDSGEQVNGLAPVGFSSIGRRDMAAMQDEKAGEGALNGRKGGEASSAEGRKPSGRTPDPMPESLYPPRRNPSPSPPATPKDLGDTLEKIATAEEALRAAGLDNRSPEHWVRKRGVERVHEVLLWASRQKWFGDPERQPGQIVAALRDGHGHAPLPTSEAAAVQAATEKRESAGTHEDMERRIRGGIVKQIGREGEEKARLLNSHLNEAYWAELVAEARRKSAEKEASETETLPEKHAEAAWVRDTMAGLMRSLGGRG